MSVGLSALAAQPRRAGRAAVAWLVPRAITVTKQQLAFVPPVGVQRLQCNFLRQWWGRVLPRLHKRARAHARGVGLWGGGGSLTVDNLFECFPSAEPPSPLMMPFLGVSLRSGWLMDNGSFL